MGEIVDETEPWFPCDDGFIFPSPRHRQYHRVKKTMKSLGKYVVQTCGTRYTARSGRISRGEVGTLERLLDCTLIECFGVGRALEVLAPHHHSSTMNKHYSSAQGVQQPSTAGSSTRLHPHNSTAVAHEMYGKLSIQQ